MSAATTTSRPIAQAFQRRQKQQTRDREGLDRRALGIVFGPETLFFLAFAFFGVFLFFSLDFFQSFVVFDSGR